MRYYAERTEREAFSRQGQRFARAQFRGVIIPAQAGTFELPPIEVNWWDTNAEQMRTASIPARTIEVHEPAGGTPSPLAQPPATDTDSQRTPPPLSLPTDTQADAAWWSPAATLFALLWLLTLLGMAYLLMFKRPHRSTPEKTPSGKAKGNVPAASRQPLQQLKQACKGQDPKAARHALQQWINSRAGKSVSPENFARDMRSDELLVAVEELNAVLYASDTNEWQGGERLWLAVQALHKRSAETRSEQRMPALYP